LLFFCVCVATRVAAQQVTIKAENAPLESVFREIKDQTNYTFVFTTELLNKAAPVNMDVTNASLNNALARLFSNQPLDYTIYNNSIIIKEKPGIKTTNIPAYTQLYSVSGVVNDEKGQPIPGATAFLTNTKKATATNGAGRFILDGLLPGPYEIVIKMLGYRPYVQTITIASQAIAIDIVLKENNITLQSVNINGKPNLKRRKEYLDLFVKNFIGQSNNAGQCRLLNPEVLSFHYDRKTDVLTASADELLEIENYSLGYELKYLLKEFELHLQDDDCIYAGYPYFEDIEGWPKMQNLWDRNRRKAYLGSCRHFFRAVINNSALQEGFELYAWNLPGKGSPIRFQPYDSLFKTTHDSVKALITKSVIRIKGNDTARLQLYVVYRRALQQHLFYNTGQPSGLPLGLPLGQLSCIRILADTILMNKELLLNPLKKFSFSGYWAWERIADYLPIDYFIDPLAEKTPPVTTSTK
jgi:hypothetical protein